ncbi:MAG: hypothetical protein ABJA94_09875 [Rhodoglobus sp.]
MTFSASIPSAPVGWRSRVVTRLTGAAASWFLFALSFALLYMSSSTVIGLGGFCASGGPYEIAVECPDSVVAFTPLSIFGGLIAVAIAVALAQGFGTPLTTWAWPTLFCGLGFAFLGGFISHQDITGLLIGIMFEIMGLVPLVLELRGSPQRVLLGQYAANGQQFYEGDKARRSLMSPDSPNPSGAVPPTFTHWIVGLGIPVIFGFVGVQVALYLFRSVVAASS